MNYKILIIIAIIASVLLSGCVNPVDNTGNFSKAPVEIIQDNSPAIPTKIYRINTNDSGYQPRLYIFHVSDLGDKYTCFYMEGGGLQVNKAISCTRDVQPVI